MIYDVAVIGAGVTGCAIARELSSFDLSIVVLEKENDVSCGTSKANTAIVHAGHDAEPGTLKAKYNVLGNEMFERICEELSVSFKKNGTLVVAFAEDRLEDIRNLYENGTGNGVKGLRLIDREDLHQMEPELDETACGALLAENGGIVSPYDLVAAYAENAAKNGAEFIFNYPVDCLKKDGDVWKIGSGEKCTEAKIVINCAGVYSDELNNMVSQTKFSITPRRGEYIILDKKNAGKFTRSICPLPSKMATGHTKGIWIAPTVSGTILLGPTAEDVESKEATENTQLGFDKILNATKAMWPKLPFSDFISSYAGLRAHGDTGDFVIGWVPDAENFYNVAAIESPGLTSAPAIGVDVAAEVAQRLGAGKKADFDPIRKAPKPFRYMTDQEREEAIASDPGYAKIVCRCEMITEAEVRQSIRRTPGARDMDGVKRRTRAGMGRCQSGFCSTRVMQILAEELGMDMTEITKFGRESRMVVGRAFEEEN